MIVFSTIASVLAAQSSRMIYLIGGGPGGDPLTPGVQYRLMFDSGGSGSQDQGTGDIQLPSTPNGYVGWALTVGASSGAPGGTRYYYLHPGSSDGDHANRLNPDAVVLDWNPSAPFPYPSYGTAAILNQFVLGDQKVLLTWAAAQGLDARASTIKYRVESAADSGGAPPPVDGSWSLVSGGSNITTTSLLVTSLTNGVPRWYRVLASIGFADDRVWAPVLNQYYVTVGSVQTPVYPSNTIKVTPRKLQTYLGALVTH